MSKKNIQVKVEKERAQFNSLLQSNPNYFGTLSESPFTAVTEIVDKKKYEELVCVGYNPNLDTLEATVSVKLASGYNGNLCQPGSTEYVRFYINYGAGWEDVGLVGFDVHDIPTKEDCAGDPNKPISYVASLPFQPRRDYCGNPVLPTVRAILSWEKEPPPASPDWPPAWGNVLECPIQIKPRSWVVFDVLKTVGNQLGQVIKVPPILSTIQQEEIAQPQLQPLAVKELVELYKPATSKRKIEAHRFGLADMEATLAAAQLNPTTLALKTAQWKQMGLDLTKSFQLLDKTKGNTSYEELTCLGLDTNREWLAATFKIKKAQGYSGKLCQNGSMEYVAFWADWKDSCDWTYLGTAQVKVHDIEEISDDGLHYTAVLPVDFSNFRQPCHKPRIGRIRAVLSWNKPPSTIDPDKVPYWGNRKDRHVIIEPGDDSTPGAKIGILGGVGIADINTAGNGLTKPFAKMSPWGTKVDGLNRECPFGGQITVHASPNLGYKYRVFVREIGVPATEQKLTDKIWVIDQNGVGSYHHADPVTGFFTYLSSNQNMMGLVASWSAGGKNGLYEIRLEMANAFDVVVDSTLWYRLRIDNTVPTAEITIDGGACDTYVPGTVIKGHFVARDAYFGNFSLDTTPNSLTPPDPTTATSIFSQTAVSPGDQWELNTTGMVPCGYVVRVHVWDRTIRDSKPGAHNKNSDDKGFCLLTG